MAYNSLKLGTFATLVALAFIGCGGGSGGGTGGNTGGGGTGGGGTNTPQAGDLKTITISGVAVNFRWCPPGTYTMGSPTTEKNRGGGEDQHQVNIPVGFWITETEVTQELYYAVMRTNPSFHTGNNKYPVENISKANCNSFISTVSASNPSLVVKLPTVEQWEYAYRAGTTTSYYNGFDQKDDMTILDPNLGKIAWYDKNSGGVSHEVAKKDPNNWHIYDMAGNVAEITASTGSYNGYTIPVIFRGGYFDYYSASCRASYWASTSDITYTDETTGFRFIITSIATTSNLEVSN